MSDTKKPTVGGIVERLRRWYHDYHDRRHELGDRHCQGSCYLVVANLMRALQPEIERLLADEREKVREAVLNEITGGRTVTNLGHIPAVARALHWIVEDIRQLDLTAPSNSDEHGRGR